MSAGNAGGRPRKDPARAQGHRRHESLALVPTSPQPDVEVQFHPDPPDGLEPAIAATWHEFWSKPRGPIQAVNWDWDKYALHRLWRLYNDEFLLEATLEAEGRVTKGSQGQDVTHPAARQLDNVRRLIFQLEHQFAMNPRSRVSFGVQLAGGRKTKEDLIREANERASQHRPTPRKAARR